jgi:hypothetical protein
MKTHLIILLLFSQLAFADTWILRDATTKAIILTAARSDGFIPEAPFTPNSEIVRVITEEQPAFNPATQKLVLTVVETGSAPIVMTRSWTITALTAPELAALADASSRLAKRQLVAQAIPTLRTWATQLEAVTVTSGNAVATLQSLIDRQEIFYARFADLLEAQRVDQ